MWTPATILLGVHVAAGAVALVVGPLALLAGPIRRWQPALAAVYQGAIAILCLTALGLVGLAPDRLWWLVPFAIGTQAAAICGWWLGRRSPSGATPGQVRLLGGSYVSLITALLVVSWGSPAAWVLPTAVGVVAVEAAAARAGRDRVSAREDHVH